MKKENLTIPCRINGAQFREFAVFDTLRHRKRWRRPIVFAAFFVIIAALAFTRADEVRGAVLLGGVLLAVGLGLPAIYFGSFFLSVRRRAQELAPDKIAYTLTLTASGADVRKDKQTVFYEWKQLYGAYRLKHGICLYVDAFHALLLPDDSDGQVWRVLSDRLGERAKTFQK